MKTSKNPLARWIALLCLVPLVWLGHSSQGDAREPATPSRKENRLDRELEMKNQVVSKTFCVAMRRNDQAKLRSLIDPRYLQRHGLDKKNQSDLPIDIAPVTGIFNLVVAADGKSVLCLYGTREGKREAMVLRTALHEGTLYVSPAGAPDPATGMFEPWMMRTDLENFIAQFPGPKTPDTAGNRPGF